MNIYIGSDFNGNITSMLLAETREKANIAWMGMQATPHHVEEIDPNDKSLGMHGVAFLLTSRKVKDTGNYRIEHNVCKRGL